MNDVIKRTTTGLESMWPQAFKAAHPRNITPPTGYANPKHYSTHTVGGLAVVRDPNMRQLPHVTGYTTALCLIANKVPTYFIGYEFAQAVANTDLPNDFKFVEIKWPLDAQLFVLPDQFVAQYYGCYAPFIAICRCKPGQYPNMMGRLPSIEIPYTEVYNQVDRIVVDYPLFSDQNMPTDYNGSYPMSLGIESFRRADWVDSTAYEEEYHGASLKAYTGIKVCRIGLSPEQEKIFVNKALNLAIKLILAVSCRPGLVEHGQCTRPVKVKKGRVIHSEMWSPNVIGRSYRIPRQITGPITVSEGPRAKPRFTFRRGHYAWQAKRFKGVEFVSVDTMPHLEDGSIDFDTAGIAMADKFRTVHERLWIEGILFGAEGTTSTPHANIS